jgi:hypothetical protein
LALSWDAGDGATGVTAAEGVGGDRFAAGVCEGGGMRLAAPAGAGVDAPGAIAAEGVVAVVGCEGGVPDLALPPGAGDGVADVVAAEGDDGVTGFAPGVCDGCGADLVLPPGAGDGVPGVIAAEGVVGVGGAPLADGRGCPFIPGNGWPGWDGGCVAAEPGALGCAPPPCGDWVWSVAAFCATEGGNAGASEVAAAGAACGDAGAGAAGTNVACGDTAAAGWAAGAIATEGGTVWVWPLGFVIDTVFVTLLMTTVLWTLL